MKIQNSMNALRAQSQMNLAEKTGRPDFSTMLEQTLSGLENSKNSAPENTGPMMIGTITQKTPTISQLLYKSPLKDNCWNIIHDKINAEKAYNKIRPGTQIMFDPESKELLWGKDLKDMMATKPPSSETTAWTREPPNERPESTQGNPAGGLSNAVKNFIGRDYDSMDCYELVVGGLKELGVQYRGKGGLGRHLVNQALAKGLPENHYLNGEGLVSESGQAVFKKTFFSVKNPQTQARDLMEEMKGVLEEGQVLSFSMRNKGHTGVVSKSQNAWTFINSGDMDHNIAGDNGSKKVGEEDLKSELENWLKLARESSQGLKITLGTLDIDRLSMFRQGSRFSGKV